MLVGLGSAASLLFVFKVVVDWFPPEKRPLMISFAISAGCMGPVIFGPSVALIVKTFDWKSVMFTHAIIGYVLAAVVWNVAVDKKQAPAVDSTVDNAEISLINALKKIVTSPQAWILALVAMMQYSPLSALADLWGTSYIKKMYDADPAISSLANNMIYFGLAFGGPFFSYLVMVFVSYK
jgi:MFS family permease